MPISRMRRVARGTASLLKKGSALSVQLAVWLEARAALWNFLAVIAALVGLWLVYEQAQLTRASNALTGLALQESRRQYEQAQRSAAQDAKEAQARFDASLAHARAEARLEESRFQTNLEISRKTAESTQEFYRRQLQQAQDLAEAQSALARDQLDQARQALALSKESLQRAEATWLSLEEVSLEIEVLKPVVARFVLRNRGRAPASKIRSTCILSLTREKVNFVQTASASAEFADTLAPGAEIKLSCRLTVSDILKGETRLSAGLLNEIKNRESSLVVALPVEYQDSFGVAQSVQGCAIFVAEDWKAAPCQSGSHWTATPEIRP